MGDNTGIEWTDASWNPVVGCTIVSPGCTHCYAMGQAARQIRCAEGLGRSTHYAGTVETVKGKPVWTGKLALAPESILMQPLRWKAPRKIFVNSMGDLFHEDVPDAWIDRVFAVMALCPQHTFQILTKRADRMRAYVGAARQRIIVDNCVRVSGDGHYFSKKSLSSSANVWPWPLPNVWLGVSAEDQRRADERIPDLLATPAAIRFVSAEPLLGPIDFGVIPTYLRPEETTVNPGQMNAVSGACSSYPTGLRVDGRPVIDRSTRAKLDWIIVGGESGPKARPMHPDWARGIRDQCAAAGTAFFFKQWGEWAPGEAIGATQWGPVTDRFGNIRNQHRYYVETETRGDRLDAHSFDGHWTRPAFRVGKTRAGRLLDGIEHNAMPEIRHG